MAVNAKTPVGSNFQIRFPHEEENRFAVGHNPTKALEELAHRVTGQEKYKILMSGLSEATQKTYFRFWTRWMTFQRWRNKEPWLNPEREGWDEDLLDWIMYENKVMGICASTIQGSISALRNMHLISGKSDFTKSGSRYKRLLTALALRHTPKTKTPFPFELVEELVVYMGHPSCSEILRENIVVIVTMFTFLLRVSELASLRWSDLRFGRSKNQRFVTIFIARSKTDQSGQGVYRPLTENKGSLCVVKILAKWATLNRWNPDSADLIFSSNITKTLTRTLEWLCATKGLPGKLYTSHSLRAGGAAHLFLSKIPLDVIQRFGRWISTCFLTYLHYDNIALRYIGTAYKEGHGVLEQQIADNQGSVLVQTEENRYRVRGVSFQHWNPRGDFYLSNIRLGEVIQVFNF